MSPDKVTCCKGTAKTQLPSQDTGGHNACKTTSIVPRAGLMRASNTQKVQTCRLWLKYRTAADGAHLDGRHGNGDLKVSVVAITQVSTVHEN